MSYREEIEALELRIQELWREVDDLRILEEMEEFSQAVYESDAHLGSVEVKVLRADGQAINTYVQTVRLPDVEKVLRVLRTEMGDSDA